VVTHSGGHGQGLIARLNVGGSRIHERPDPLLVGVLDSARKVATQLTVLLRQLDLDLVAHVIGGQCTHNARQMVQALNEHLAGALGIARVRDSRHGVLGRLQIVGDVNNFIGDFDGLVLQDS